VSGLRFNLLLEAEGLDPANVSVILHTTNQQPLRRMLPWIAAERPDLFDAYQSVHSRQAEATLGKRPYTASFVPLREGKLVFVGLYLIAGIEDLPTVELYGDPRFGELETKFGAADTAPARNIARAKRQNRFDLELSALFGDLRGRLQIESPPGRAYVRIAANLGAEIVALSEAPILVLPPPDWRDFILTGGEVRGLPVSWAMRLAEWRGVYLIVDRSDGARYVGPAYGAENLLGRWRAHVANERGVTRELSKRSPENYQFSILERVSPDASIEEVTTAEQSWMTRLDTVRNGLNS